MRRRLESAARMLAGAGIASARLDAELLLADTLGCDRLALWQQPENRLDPLTEAGFSARLARRAAGEPVAYITGYKAFWAHEFRVSPAVLIPRPDSELLVEAAQTQTTQTAQTAQTRPPQRILDLGTGSGALLLSVLAALPGATGIGVDRSPAALAVAAVNAQRLSLGARAAFRLGDWFAPVGADHFDLILCNPPYVAVAEHQALMPDVRAYEPVAALIAGADGLDAYRALLPAAAQHLAPGGQLLLEIGATQAAAVTALMRAAGLNCAGPLVDLAGHPRVLRAWPAHS